MSARDEIAALRVRVGAKTDSELARILGVGKSAVSQWATRGVPDKYKSLLIDLSPEGAREAMAKALKIQVFGRIEPAYWLRAALAVLPAEALAEGGETPQERGRRLERLVLELMNAAYEATYMVHGRELCRDDGECDRVIDLMVSEEADNVAAILAKGPEPKG